VDAIARATGPPTVGMGSPSQPNRWAVLVVMCAGYFLVLLDVTIVNVALPHIGSGLHASVSALQWVVDGYAIALASLMLTGGMLGDLRGHRRVVLAGLALFGIGSLSCGFAPSTAPLVGARVLQGIGAALLLPGTLAVITHAFPARREQARAIGVWAGIGSAALPAGPLLGGGLVDWIGWRWIFLLNVPIVIAAFLVATWVVPRGTEDSSRRLDLAGTTLGALFLACVTFAFIEGGHAGSRLPVLAAIAAVVLLGAFVAVERARSDTMFPLALFRRPDFCAANAAAGAMNLGTLGMLFVLTLYLQDVQGRSALAAGVAVVPLFAPLAVLAPVSGRLTARHGPRLPMALGLVVSAVGLGLLIGLSAGSDYVEILPALLLWGIGLGILTPAVVAAAMAAVPPHRAGLASAVNNTARQAGGAIGIAALGAVAGSPARTGQFLAGMHSGALIASALYGLAAVTTLLFISADAGRRRSSGPAHPGGGEDHKHQRRHR
jgi:MFS transporter, DHA2 family, methylenomycin A resistance protein